MKTIDEYGNVRYYNENHQRHRTDGPAIECVNGYKAWCINGQFHRTDGPAIEYDNGTKAWFINGQYHRTDGPAVEYPDGTKCANGDKEWWIKGEYLTEQEFNQLKYQQFNDFSEGF